MQAILKAFPVLLLSVGLASNSFAQMYVASDALHKPFTEVLRANVSNGQVNYAGIKSNPRFGEYLHALKQARPDTFTTKAERLVFWINAYNAMAIKGIVDGHSPDSFWGRLTYFKTTDYEIAGRSINLYDLEHEILMPFHDPRIHFAIVCASRSCPKLRSEAYLAATLEQQLNDNAVDFINDPDKNVFDDTGKRAYLSKIFDWFAKDFKQHSGSVQKYVATFINEPALKQALSQEKYRVKYLAYDWHLNGTPPN